MKYLQANISLHILVNPTPIMVLPSRPIIYSVLPRLWGNDTPYPQPNGSIRDNGVGKLADFDAIALDYIRQLGATHIWYIGLLEHATQADFSHWGIERDPASIVKGQAGSPYAIRDYYDISPTLATHPEKRMQEFEDLVARTHQAGMGVIIDFVPNHVGRSYHSDSHPKGAEDFGRSDRRDLAFSPLNNFYYLPGEMLYLPTEQRGVGSQPYQEYPAKATGNDCFSAHPSACDWYETVKLNYGVDYLSGGSTHFSPIPDTWFKMRAILLFWVSKGIDGFRCDMAEMVPPAFWAWVIPQIKEQRDVFFLAEIYQPDRYTEYLQAGFDYLYDKVGVYDCLSGIIRGERPASDFVWARDAVGNKQEAMCYFLENHDEVRLPSTFFAGSTLPLRPALAIAVLSGGNPYLHYFAGELGERGMDSEGFSGLDGRTSIFDFWSLDKLRRLREGGYTGAHLLPAERALHDYHQLLLADIAQRHITRHGKYYDLSYLQTEALGFDRHRDIAFVRYLKDEWLLVVASFSPEPHTLGLRFTPESLSSMGLEDNIALGYEECTIRHRGITTITILAPYSISLGDYGVYICHLRRL